MHPDEAAQIDNECDEIAALVADDRVFQSIVRLKKLDADVAAKGIPLTDQQTSLLRPVRKALAQLVRMKEELNSPRFQLAGDWKGIQTSIWKDADNKQSFKVCGVVDAPLFNILSLIYEVDLFKDWMPGCLNSSKVASYSKFSMACYQEFFAPWPVSNRDTILKGYGDVDADGVCISMCSMQDDEIELLGDKCPPVAGVRAECEYGGIVFKPLREGGVQVSLMMKIDIKLGLIPSSLVNYVTEKVFPYIIQMMREKAKDLDPKWQSRIDANEDNVYGTIRERLAENGMTV